MKTLIFLLVGGLWLAPAQAAIEAYQFDSPQMEADYNKLVAELRCLVCQNQNLADSDAPLAHDLRDEIFEMLQAGRSDEEIKRFLVERYGDFVLYRPPVKGNTLILWLAPAVLLIGGAVVVGANVRRRQRLLEPAGGGEES